MITEVEGMTELNGNEYSIQVDKNNKKIKFYYDKHLTQEEDSSKFTSYSPNTGRINRNDNIFNLACIKNYKNDIVDGASALIFYPYEKNKGKLDEIKKIKKRNGNFIGDRFKLESKNMNLGYDEGVYTVIDYDIDTVNDFFRIIVEEPVIGDRIPILDGVITIEKLKALPYDINDEINITIVNKNYVELYPKYNYAKITFKESDLIDYYNYSNFNEHTVNLYDDDEDQCLKDDIADGLGINNFKYNFTDEFIDILQDYNSIDSKYESSIIKIDKRDNNFTQYHYLNTYDLVEFFLI